MKYHIITFGCQMNKSDSERIATILEKTGYQPAKADCPTEADLIVINMCSVRQSAVDRVYGFIKKIPKLKSQNKNFRALLTGCISKKDLEKFKNQFDFILSIKTLKIWPKFLKEKRLCFYPDPRDKKFIEEFGACYLKEKPKYSKNFSVFIPISTGCDNFCSFCIVPFVRGPLICRDHKEILKEAKEAIKNGAKEIWLLGQNVNDYLSPTDLSINFPKLLKMINEIEGNFWIRFTSPHPKNFSDELIETMAKCQKVTPYLNLPLQSGDNEILRKMNRKYSVAEYQNVVKKLRLAFKKYRKGLEKMLAISTDIIVGFPGEKRKHFENTKKFFKKIGFFMAYIAQYSPRLETAAALLKDDVSKNEKERREKELTKILEKIALKFNKKFLGKTVEVLVNEKKKDFYLGKTRHHQTIKLKSDKDILGNFVRVKVIKAMPFGLEGKLIR